MAKVAIVIQARLKSTRLPGKTMLILPNGLTVIQEVIRRCEELRVLSIYRDDIKIIAAIPDTQECDILYDHIEASEIFSGLIIHRGSEDDVLSRFYGAIRRVPEASHVMRITADCPCINTLLCASILERHIDGCSDYTSNTINRTYPHGYDCEVFKSELLVRAYESTSDPYDREHVTPFIKRVSEKIISVEQEYYEGMTRLTLDTIDDYVHICKFLGVKNEAGKRV